MLDVNLVFICYFICHTIITKNKGKERERERNEVARRPNRNYRSL